MSITSFDQLPVAVNEVLQRLEHLEQILITQSKQAAPAPDRLLTIEEAAAFLHLSIATIYGKVHNREIPFSKQRKRLYFSSLELEDWVKTGRRKTRDEQATEAANLIDRQKKQNAKS